MFQMKEQDKTLGKKILNKKRRSNLPDKKFKVMVLKIFTKLGRRMDEHSENFNKERENTRKYLREVITELKNTLEGFNSRLDEAENRSVS